MKKVIEYRWFYTVFLKKIFLYKKYTVCIKSTMSICGVSSAQRVNSGLRCRQSVTLKLSID